jgi:hypothetical protein
MSELKKAFFQNVRENRTAHAITLLDSHHADPNWREGRRGYTALGIALINQNSELVEYLLSRSDLDPNFPDEATDYAPLNIINRLAAEPRIDRKLFLTILKSRWGLGSSIAHRALREHGLIDAEILAVIKEISIPEEFRTLKKHFQSGHYYRILQGPWIGRKVGVVGASFVNAHSYGADYFVLYLLDQSIGDFDRAHQQIIIDDPAVMANPSLFFEKAEPISEQDMSLYENKEKHFAAQRPQREATEREQERQRLLKDPRIQARINKGKK